MLAYLFEFFSIVHDTSRMIIHLCACNKNSLSKAFMGLNDFVSGCAAFTLTVCLMGLYEWFLKQDDSLGTHGIYFTLQSSHLLKFRPLI